MKNVLKGILIALGVIMLVGLAGCVGSVLLVGTAIDETVTEMEQESLEDNITYNDLVQAIEWNFTSDGYGETLATGILTNTTDKEIEYIEIEYKFIKDGVTVDSSLTNEVNIMPGESVKIEIVTFEEFDTMEVKGTDGWN